MEKPNKNKGKPKFKGRSREDMTPRAIPRATLGIDAKGSKFPFTRQGLVKGRENLDTKTSNRYQARPGNSPRTRKPYASLETSARIPRATLGIERPERRNSYRKDDGAPRLPRVHRGDVITKKVVEKTSWGKEASWYAEHLERGDTYHTQVILPNLLRVVLPEKEMNILEIGCGEGFFARAFAEAGATVVASDIGSELIAIAKKKAGGPTYHVSSGDDLAWVESHSQDAVVAVLTLQNMEKLEPVFKEVARTLKKGGRLICVLNHPAFRIPKATAWGFDEEMMIQYRRIDAYLSARREKMDMHPGEKGNKSFTYSFHRSLQDYMKAFRASRFAITRLEEWVSHKTSEKGPRSKAENDARKEFPLFMMIEAKII